MKAIASLILTLAMVAGATAQQPAHRAKILKIEGQAQQTPSFQISGVRDKAAKPRH